MDKKLRSEGKGSTSHQDAPGPAAALDSGSPGARGSGRGVFVNERGEVCYGNDCFTLAIDEERREIRVNIKQSSTCSIDPIVDSLRKTLGKGSRTVFEIENDK
jgi:hypothetical protein